MKLTKLTVPAEFLRRADSPLESAFLEQASHTRGMYGANLLTFFQFVTIIWRKFGCISNTFN